MDEPPDTAQFPASTAPAPARGSRDGAGTLWLVLLLVTVIIAAGSWLLLSVRDPDREASESVAPAVTVTETVPAEPPEAALRSDRRAAQPTLPAGANAANEAARSGTRAGDLNNVYTGSPTTSEEFARAVRDAYVSHYLANGELSATVEARSPVTGTVYSMRCTDDGGIITCRGGDNAVVYIT